MKSALVLGAGGLIGNRTCEVLKERGYFVKGADLKYPEFNGIKSDFFILTDLRIRAEVRDVVDNYDEIYQYAADMGGAGWVFTGEHDADIMHNSASINLNLLDVLKEMKYKGKIFYSSSACMYPQEIQEHTESEALAEHMAYPGNPDSEYGWEKLFSERMYLAYARNYGLDVRIARFHNIFGINSCYNNGRKNILPRYAAKWHKQKMAIR
jgi:GDP-D-mannose 3',5'-epimerase